ncbi:hypothetical protein HDU80_001425 [Chytriomyces hyalinus]|nr:hypothetical protein HDU80_001425 [Chytriomyces hyalinus]
MAPVETIAQAFKPQSPPTFLAPSHVPELQQSHAPSVEAVENKIRAHIWAKRIRLGELFADFDKLRSGFLTRSQFRRCLGGAMETGVPLTEGEYNVLIDSYKGIGIHEGRIKWHKFVDSIDKVFGAKQLERTPTLYIPAPHEVVKPVRPPLTPKSESTLKEVMEHLRQYVKHHGSDVKSWFTDFDKYNGGYITENQFRRGIPTNLLSQEEEDVLLSQYSDQVTGTVNYFKMNTDVNRKEKKSRRTGLDHATLTAKLVYSDFVENEHVPIGTEELLHAVIGSHVNGKPSIEFVEELIQRQVYKDRIRLIEFFRDYDRHNFGLVTEAQFRAGICLTRLNLEEAHIKTLIDAYKDKEGRIAYRKFCYSVEEIFTRSNLEKTPLREVVPPAREFLVQASNELAPAEEARCQVIIARLRTLMKERRLLLAPFFHDFDKYLGNLGRVTRSHFSRLLSTMKLDVSDNDLHILFKKFEDRAQTKVNYMEFIRTIDPETYHAYLNKPGSETDATTTANTTRTRPISRRISAHVTAATSHAAVMDRIRYHAATKRVRVAEFFRDFDKLRCYSIPRQEFIRGINRIGLTLGEAEYEALADAYEDRGGKKGCCRWKDFEQDIERVFNDVNLESQPTKAPTVTAVSVNPFLSADHLSDEEHAILKNTLKGIANHMRIRQTSIKPFFTDFDKLCTGHVTKTQFRQCLTYLKVHVSDAEFEILCKRWSNSAANKACEDESLQDAPVLEQEDLDNCCLRDPIKNGAERICYIVFLSELDALLAAPKSSEGEEMMPKVGNILQIGGITLNAKDAATIANAKPIPALNAPKPTSRRLTPPKHGPLLSQGEVNNLLTRIKLKAKTERIRVIDFMADFDHLKHGKITKNEFRRALKVLYLDLTESELETLETLYQNTFDHGMVNYVAFSDAVESVFTFKGLINAPTMEPQPFTGYENGNVDPLLNSLTESENEILNRVVSRLREKVRQRRIDVLSYLEDFDFVNEGTITTNQFRSVMNSIDLPVDDAEITVLARRFTQDKNLDRVNYRAFAAVITNGGASFNGGAIW